jgi:hypothetical protein
VAAPNVRSGVIHYRGVATSAPSDVRYTTNNDQTFAAVRLVEMGQEQTRENADSNLFARFCRWLKLFNVERK